MAARCSLMKSVTLPLTEHASQGTARALQEAMFRAASAMVAKPVAVRRARRSRRRNRDLEAQRCEEEPNSAKICTTDCAVIADADCRHCANAPEDMPRRWSQRFAQIALPAVTATRIEMGVTALRWRV